MTDTTYALFNRTWLLHCDICDDRVRLAAETTDAAEWQTFINRWKAEHHGHVYLDSAPCGPGPGTVAVADGVSACLAANPTTPGPGPPQWGRGRRNRCDPKNTVTLRVVVQVPAGYVRPFSTVWGRSHA